MEQRIANRARAAGVRDAADKRHLQALEGYTPPGPEWGGVTAGDTVHFGYLVDAAVRRDASRVDRRPEVKDGPAFLHYLLNYVPGEAHTPTVAAVAAQFREWAEEWAEAACHEQHVVAVFAGDSDPGPPAPQLLKELPVDSETRRRLAARLRELQEAHPGDPNVACMVRVVHSLVHEYRLRGTGQEREEADEEEDTEDAFGGAMQLLDEFCG